MRNILLICRSQTEAFKVLRLLERGGVRGVMTRPPREEQTSSCSYAVRIDGDSAAQAQAVLRSNNFISYRAVAQIDK